MVRPRSQQPSGVELQILEVLWRDGPSTARHVHGALGILGRQATTASIHIALRAMMERGFVRRKRRSRAEGGALFTALVTRQNVGEGILGFAVRKIFGASKPAIETLLKDEQVSEQELKELEALIRKKRKERKRE